MENCGNKNNIIKGKTLETVPKHNETKSIKLDMRWTLQTIQKLWQVTYKVFTIGYNISWQLIHVHLFLKISIKEGILDTKLV